MKLGLERWIQLFYWEHINNLFLYEDIANFLERLLTFKVNCKKVFFKLNKILEVENMQQHLTYKVIYNEGESR